MQCEFCKKDFSTKTNMLVHQKNAKYCLDIQGKENKNFECEYCKRSFTSQQTVNEHFHTCREKQKIEYFSMEKKYTEYIKKIQDDLQIKLTEMEQKYQSDLLKKEEQYKEKLEEKERQSEEKEKSYQLKLEEKKEIIDKLEAKLEKFENVVIANTRNPITTNNTNIVVNHTLNLNDTQRFKTIIGEGLDKNVVCNGQKGLAKFVVENLLKGPDGKLMYKCVDPSRQNFEFTNSDGIVEKDVRAIKLKRALIEGDVIVRAKKSGDDLWIKEDGSMDTDRYTASSGKVMEIMTVDRDDTKFRSELSALTS